MRNGINLRLFIYDILFNNTLTDLLITPEFTTFHYYNNVPICNYINATHCSSSWLLDKLEADNNYSQCYTNKCNNVNKSTIFKENNTYELY